jgi:hypothetical protein
VLGGRELIWSEDLVKELWMVAEAPWASMPKTRKPLTTNELSSMLRGFKIRSTQLKIGAINRNGYRAADFADAFERYL